LDDFGDGTGSLTLAPGFFDSGTYPIVIRARDTDALFDELNVTITVTDVNRDPTLSVIDQIDVDEDDTAVIPVSSSDPDGDEIALSMTGSVTFASLTDNGDGTGTLEVQPGFSDSGAYALSIRATDAQGAFIDASVSIDVANVNRQPSITPLANVALTEIETQIVVLSASDPDGDGISLSGIGLPGFVTLTDDGDGTGTLLLEPDFDASGIYPVTMRVTDTPGAFDETNFFITVGDVNRAPTLSSIADVTLAEGNDQTILVNANDPDGDNLAFEADNLPGFVSLNELGGGMAELRIEPAPLDSGSYSIVVRAVDSGFPTLSVEQPVEITVNLEGANHVAAENALPGTPDWHLDSPALAREIEGYASATSVNRGEPISLFVNTNAPSFTLEVFRTGWYQGIGARRLLGPIDIPGTSQITPAPDPTTGLVEANWVNAYEIQTSDSLLGDPWPTGVYLARLTESAGGRQSYIIFVVREDGHQHDVLFQLPVTTYQAYNAWGGKSVYDWNSGSTEPWGSTAGTRASHISFDRPYARNPYDPAGYGMGAGEYLTNVQPVGRIDGAGWDYNMVRWLEHEQYDVGYITNIDTHRSPEALLNTEVFISQGHDEYWSWAMRDNVEAARDSGIDLAFFSSNAAYYQIRFEPSPTSAVPNRVMVVYKDAALDPVYNDANPLNDYQTTIPFRYLPVPRPEEALIGVQYVLDPYDGDIVVTNPTHWVFDKTGFVFGSRLEGLLGYEPDGIFDVDIVSNREVLAETPIVSSVDPTETGTSHMTIYSTPQASVFATGSLQWSWGLDDYNAPALRTSRLSAMAQQITGNVLEDFGATPYAGENVITASCVRIDSLSDVTNDQTMAAAEFDMLDENGQAIPKSGWSLRFFDSEETVGWDHRAAYAIDDDPGTFWQTEWYGAGHPHRIEIDLGGSFDISALRYVPRQDYSLDGTLGDYAIYTSPDCASWSLVDSGTWDASHGRKISRFAAP
ncbi:MAG: Ig-like domain-containing protein, partial [Gammaproteobacteria bacterium]